MNIYIYRLKEKKNRKYHTDTDIYREIINTKS